MTMFGFVTDYYSSPATLPTSPKKTVCSVKKFSFMNPMSIYFSLETLPKVLTIGIGTNKFLQFQLFSSPIFRYQFKSVCSINKRVSVIYKCIVKVNSDAHKSQRIG